MDKEQANELLVKYEDLILESSKTFSFWACSEIFMNISDISEKMLWLLKTEHGKRYQFAVHKDVHGRIIARLEKIHEKLLEYAEN